LTGCEIRNGLLRAPKPTFASLHDCGWIEETCRRPGSPHAGAKRLALTHHDPLRSDAELESIEKDAQAKLAMSEPLLEHFAAAEGMTVDLDVSARATPSMGTDEFSAVA
jgi:hypothetical protein